MDIKGKIVIVTGASSGIGEATAKLFAKQGAKAALVARSKKKLEKLSAELSESFVVVTDMRDEKQIKEMVKKVLKHYGRIDILINNAGRGYDADIENIDTEKFKELFQLDVLGPLVAMQEVIPIMKKHGGGSIINISSGTALINIPGMAAYSSLKKALVGISLTARAELKDNKITVGIVYPYITITNFDKNMIGGSVESLTEEARVNRNLPEFDPPEHVARKILEAVKTGAAEIYAHDWVKNASDK
jgi:short-subunit dehydrogenase